jgi:hypothetical protein
MRTFTYRYAQETDPTETPHTATMAINYAERFVWLDLDADTSIALTPDQLILLAMHCNALVYELHHPED